MIYDPSMPIGYVRLIISDTDQSGPVFNDLEIQAFLDREKGPLRAAARALEIIADSEARLAKAIRTQDLQTDGAKTADSLRRHAASLRAQAARDGDTMTGEDPDEVGVIVPYQAAPTAPELAGFRRFGDAWLH